MERHVARAVVEVRLAHGSHGELAARLRPRFGRVEVLADRVWCYGDDGEAMLATIHAQGCATESALVRRGSLATGFALPVPYLAAVGVGLGGLVDRHVTGKVPSSIGGIGSLSFVAPGLLAGPAMQIATSEATFPAMAALKWERRYDAMLATPLGVCDVLAGHLAYLVALVACASVVAGRTYRHRLARRAPRTASSTARGR